VSGRVDADWFFLRRIPLSRPYSESGSRTVSPEQLAAEVHLFVGFRVHEVEIVAFVVEVLEFDFVENGAVDKFFGRESDSQSSCHS